MQGDQRGIITQLFFAKCVNGFLVQLPPDGDVVGPHNGDQDGDLVDVLHGDGVARNADRLQGPRHKICGQLDFQTSVRTILNQLCVFKGVNRVT